MTAINKNKSQEFPLCYTAGYYSFFLKKKKNFFFWLPRIMWSSQARDCIRAGVVTYATAVAMPDP